MAPSREIEKLQRRWQENPLGLTFAPLAEAYRKEGMLADALDLLGIGLAQHPTYVPAHIVKGRCFLDAQSDPDAEQAFLKVTELDPENVIALKGLAEIAERGSQYPVAIERLERLLEFDRSNEEARAQLDRLKALEAVSPSSEQPATPREPIAAAAELAAPMSVEAEPPAIVESTAPDSGSIETAELPRAEIIQPSEPNLEVTRYSPVELSATAAGEYQNGSDADTLQPSAARGGLDQDEPPPTPEASYSTTADIDIPPMPAEAPELEVAPEPPAMVEATVDPTPEESPVDNFVADLAAMPAEALEVDEDVPTAVEEEVVADAQMAEPELVVTETMAEVFLRQGHRELALAVYTQLGSRDPSNQRIREAVGKLEAEFRPNQASIIPVYAAVLTGGQSIRAYFEHLLARRRPGTPSGDDLSLGEVFGDEGTGRGAAGQAKPDPSFDEFYADSQEALPAVPVAPPPVEAASTGDDLEGFTDWLKGLRR